MVGSGARNGVGVCLEEEEDASRRNGGVLSWGCAQEASEAGAQVGKWEGGRGPISREPGEAPGRSLGYSHPPPPPLPLGDLQRLEPCHSSLAEHMVRFVFPAAVGPGPRGTEERGNWWKEGLGPVGERQRGEEGLASGSAPRAERALLLD